MDGWGCGAEEKGCGTLIRGVAGSIEWVGLT